MDFFRGGHVKIRGKRQKMTVAVSLPDDEVEPAKVREKCRDAVAPSIRPTCAAASPRRAEPRS